MYLTPSSDIATIARTASEHLFALLKPYTPKSPFERLLVDDKFDAEQIWQQMDLQSQPLISALRRQVNKFEKDPKEVVNMFRSDENEKEVGLEEESEEYDDMEDDDVDDDEDDDVDDEIEGGKKGEGKERKRSRIEDEFLDLKEMELMHDDEDGDFGTRKKSKAAKKAVREYDEDDEDEEGGDDEDDDDDDEVE